MGLRAEIAPLLPSKLRIINVSKTKLCCGDRSLWGRSLLKVSHDGDVEEIVRAILDREGVVPAIRERSINRRHVYTKQTA